MTNLIFQGAVLGLLLALVAYFHLRYGLRGGIQRGAFSWLSFWKEELGVVNVLYFIAGGVVRINGSATPPTAIQASQVPLQRAQVVMADSDTQALFTHNWGLGASGPTYFFPSVINNPQLLNAGGTYMPGFTYDWTNTNVLKINKLNFLGTGGTFIVELRRDEGPWQ